MSDSDLNTPLAVKELRVESTDCMSIVFEKPRDFTFESGMWIAIRLPFQERA